MTAVIEKLWHRENVVSATSPEAAAKAFGLAPDWTFSGKDIAVLHRRVPEADIYFVVNRATIQSQGTFAIPARASLEWWNAVDGTKTKLDPAILDGRAQVALNLAANESGFVVARDTPSPDVAAPREFKEAAVAARNWQVIFTSRGLPDKTIRSFQLGWLNENPASGIRQFSGVASYTGSLKLSPKCRGARYRLDLGEMADVAHVNVNGHDAGIVWASPHGLDVTGLVHPGSNTLRIDVANLWVNRLIAQAGSDPKSPAATMYSPGAPLRNAGMKGPVRLLESCPAGRAPTG